MAVTTSHNPWASDHWTAPAIDDSEVLPVVTIGVLNYNRCTELRATLDCLTKAIIYPHLEIIVVDNGSSDGSVEMVRREFPTVILIALDTNYATAARNHFYRKAKGKYVFSYDDDSFPATPLTIYNAVSFLEQFPEYDSVCFFCFQPKSRFAETAELENFGYCRYDTTAYDGVFFVEGGMCFRRSSFLQTEGYDPHFIWGSEGFEHSLQMYKIGMRMAYYPALATLHMKSSANRNAATNIRLVTRNQIWTIKKHFPFYAACAIIVLYCFRKLISAMVDHPQWRAYFLGMYDGIKRYPGGYSRTKLSVAQMISLKKWYIGFLRW